LELNGKAAAPRVLVLVGGGGYYFEAQCLLGEMPSDVDLAIATNDPCYEHFLAGNGMPTRGPARFFRLCEQRSTNHSGLHVTAYRLIKSLIQSFGMMKRFKPDVVIGVGDPSSVPLLAVARLFGAGTIYIETLARVHKASNTGRIISRLRLADKFYVQWPQAVEMYRQAEYLGRVS
jgi:beta-1,4-N-acetylglucosaminyltransferase